MHLQATVSRASNGFTATFHFNNNPPQIILGTSLREFAENLTRTKINDAFGLRGWVEESVVSLEVGNEAGLEISTWSKSK